MTEVIPEAPNKAAAEDAAKAAQREAFEKIKQSWSGGPESQTQRRQERERQEAAEERERIRKEEEDRAKKEEAEDDEEHLADDAVGEADEGDDEDPELEEARDILRRAKIPKSVLSKMDEDEILELADAQSEVQDGFQDKLDDLSDQIRQLKSPDEEPDDGTPTSRQTSRAFEKAEKELKAMLGDEFSEEMGGRISSAIRSMIEAAVPQDRGPQVHPEVERSLEALDRAVSATLIGQLRTRLQADYPQLERDRTWKRVSRKAQSWGGSDDYQGLEGLESAHRDAAKILLGEVSVPKGSKDRRRARARSERVRPRQRRGKDKSRGSVKNLSVLERQRIAFDKIRELGSGHVSEARRAAGFDTE